LGGLKILEIKWSGATCDDELELIDIKDSEDIIKEGDTLY